jgi:hypothetical protein
MPNPPTSDERLQQRDIKGLLAHVPVIESACDLDLLVFLFRHPRALLTTEQLASFVGYNLKQIAKALDTFIDAGCWSGRPSSRRMLRACSFSCSMDLTGTT